MTDRERIATASEDIASELKKIRRLLEDADLAELSRLVKPILESIILRPRAG